MIGYLLDGVNPQAASAHPLMAGRLRAAGPWQYQAHAGGTLATWRGAGTRAEDLGVARPVAEGIRYLPPRALPSPDDLARQERAGDSLEAVTVDDQGTVLHIVPALLTPRAILSSGLAGDPATRYGREAHAAFRAIAAAPEDKEEAARLAVAVCRLALCYSYRLTDELLDDLGWINESSVTALWEAVTKPPKAADGNG